MNDVWQMMTNDMGRTLNGRQSLALILPYHQGKLRALLVPFALDIRSSDDRIELANLDPFNRRKKESSDREAIRYSTLPMAETEVGYFI